MLRIAAARADDLSKEQSSLAEPYFLAIKGALAAAQNDRAGAVELLRLAVAAFESAHYKLCAAAVQLQLGRYIGGAEGQSLVAEAEQVMRDEAIVDPLRVSAVFAPVLPAAEA